METRYYTIECKICGKFWQGYWRQARVAEIVGRHFNKTNHGNISVKLQHGDAR